MIFLSAMGIALLACLWIAILWLVPDWLGLDVLGAILWAVLYLSATIGTLFQIMEWLS